MSPNFRLKLFLSPVLILLFLSMKVKAETVMDNPLPEQWQYSPEYYQTSPADDSWWATFNDPVLSELISKAVTNNYNVASALKRIQMAKKEIGIARSGYSPSISLSAGWNKNVEGGAMSGMDVSRMVDDSYFSVGASMNWEIDVFGRVYSNVKEKKAAYNVARADYDAVMVSLCASVATAYMQLRTYQEEIRVAREHIESQKYVCKITESRYEADLGDMLDVTQARVVLYQTESTLPTLEANVKSMKNSLAILVGEYPGAIDELLESRDELPDYRQTVAIGMPAEILRRRPDIMEAEMEVAEYAAAVGVAKKDFMPTLSLTGEIGTSSRNINGLFGKNSLVYSVAPQLSWTLFDGLERNYALSESKLQLESAIDQYKLTVMTAVEEVDNALTNYSALLNSIELQKRVVAESKKSLDLSFELYRSGLTMFTNVMDSQISWLTNQNTLTTMQGDALSALVTIYKALGGGWESFSKE